MIGLTLLVSEHYRSVLLEQLSKKAQFQSVICVNSYSECCPASPALRTDGLIIELSCTSPSQLQGLCQLMEAADYCPAMLVFDAREDGSLRYVLSDEGILPVSTQLETLFTEALQPHFPCCRWHFRSAPWPEENTRFVFSARTAALRELMYGATEPEVQYYISAYQLDFREAGYYAYYWELDYTLYINHAAYKDLFNYFGERMRVFCRDILNKYSGGEVFYTSLTQVCAVINDFRLSSESQNRRRLNELLSELMSVTDSNRTSHYISKKFRSIRNFREIYDTYLSERRLSFFENKDRFFDSAAARKELTDADPKIINDVLDEISRYLNYDVNNIALDHLLQHLFFDILKPSCDFPMYYYTASALSSKLMNADNSLDKKKFTHSMDPNYLRHSTIDAEYETFCRAVENVRRQIGSAKQSKSSLIVKMQDFIQNNYRESILVSDIAGALYVSETYLSRICKSLTGKSVIQNLIDYRISRAKIALAKEDISIYAIAEQCGFRDVRHFSKTFKKITGQSPTEYRRDHF